MAAKQEHAWRGITARVLASTVGAYALCYAWTGAAVRLLPLEAVDANILATCFAFVLFVVVILRAFALGSAQRVWLELLAGTALPICLIWGIGQ